MVRYASKYNLLRMLNTFIYPTNNFGHHNNTHYYFYGRYVIQGNNWNNYSLHQVELVNDTDNSDIEVVEWHMDTGRV